MRFRWSRSNGAFFPLRAFAERAGREFVDEAVYQLAPHEDRSDKTHRHEFAFIREAWKQLPEELAEAYPSPKALRKRALIAAGFYTEQIIDAGSNAAALRVASGIRAFPGDDFPIVVVRGPLVAIRRAKSQSYRAMDRAEFARSKEAVLAVVAELIGVDPEALQNARAA